MQLKHHSSLPSAISYFHNNNVLYHIYIEVGSYVLKWGIVKDYYKEIIMFIPRQIVHSDEEDVHFKLDRSDKPCLHQHESIIKICR